MKESYRKGLASHPDPESCAEDGNTLGEALTGAHTGQLSSSENSVRPACRPGSLQGKATSEVPSDREAPQDAAESENLSMCGNSMHENRETPSAPRSDDLGRLEKDDHNANMHADGGSDGPIVPGKRANKGGKPPLAGAGEGGGRAGTGGPHKGPSPPRAERHLPSAAVEAHLLAQTRWTPTPNRDCGPGGQDRATGDTHGARADLRGRFSRLQLRFPT